MKENLLGQKFNRLLVINTAEPQGKNKRIAWVCRCDCGTEKIIRAENLKNGDAKSCGCLNNEKRKERAPNLYASSIKFHPSETSARRVWKKRYSDGQISFDDFYKISQLPCHYCGSLPNNTCNGAKEDPKSSQYARDNGDFIYNGLDRIDSNLKHTLENLVPCCKWCNYSKRERSTEEFLKWITKVHNFSNIK